MKTIPIPKRADIYSNMNDKNQNIEKQMSELLQMKNLLNSKLQVLTKSIGEDIYRFTNKNYPRQVKDLNLMNLQKNLFGTDRTFGQFSIDFKELMLKLQSQVKGVVLDLQKFSFTKNISIFISNGIMDGLLKLNDLMLRRQEFCNKLMHRIQQSVMNGSTIFSKHFGSNSLCMKCGSNLQKDKVISTKQSILLGGPKISNLYHKQLFVADQGDDESNQETDLYGKITNTRGNIKTAQGTDPHEIKSQQDIRHNLERLQSNIEQRKFDILACLMEMGQFGSNLIKSSQMMENIMKHNSITKEITKFSDLLPSIHKLPPKFNFKEFAFDVSKHFHKQIKDIEVQLSGIKTKYKTLLQAQYQQSMSKQIQCDIGREEFEKQMEKYKKKMQRQITSLNERIAEIEKLNKGYKFKIDEYESALKSQIFSKLEDDKNKSVENITVQKRISQLVDQDQKRIKVQQKQLKSFRDSKLNIQSLLKAQDFQVLLAENAESSKQVVISENQKQNLSQFVDKIQNIEVKKKISLFLQPIMRKLSLDVQNKKFQSSLNLNQNKSEKNLAQITKCVPDKGFNGQHLPRNKRQSIMELKENDKGLKIYSSVVDIHVTSQKFGHVDFGLRRTIIRPHQRRQSQVLHPRQIQILTDKDSNKIMSHFNQRQNEPKMKQIKGPKLIKVKSQQNTKIDKIDRSYQDMPKMGKKVQLNYAEGVKKYTSEHDGNVFDKKGNISTNKNIKQKANKKALKALSLTILKKGQQDQPKSSIKLPSLSQYQKPQQKIEKMKKLQKVPQMNSKSNLLMKKKRKKRNFSQQSLAVEALFNNQQMTMSLGTNLQKQIKNKPKKEYIIDFIPKIQQSNVSKCKQDQKVLIEGHISDLFDIKQVKKTQIQMKKVKKGKYFTKTMHTKDNDDYMTQKLKKQQIQLSTKLYSLMAALKSTNFIVYKQIRQKLRHQFQKRLKIKTNCDHISMTMDVGEKSVSHLPLSLSLNHVQMQGCQSSFQLKKQIYQSMSTNSNDVERCNDGNVKNQADKVKEEHEFKPDSAQLNKIINFLIVKHRNMCQKKQNKQEIEQKSAFKICDHLQNFYQSLVNFAGKSPSQPATVEKK